MHNRWSLAAPVPILDGLTVMVFVIIGRANHHHGENVGGVLSTLWPFALGVIVGWTVLIGKKQSGRSLRNGVVVMLSTVAIGMVLRVVSGQGTAFAFKMCIRDRLPDVLQSSTNYLTLKSPLTFAHQKRDDSL